MRREPPSEEPSEDGSFKKIEAYMAEISLPTSDFPVFKEKTRALLKAMIAQSEASDMAIAKETSDLKKERGELTKLINDLQQRSPGDAPDVNPSSSEQLIEQIELESKEVEKLEAELEQVRAEQRIQRQVTKNTTDLVHQRTKATETATAVLDLDIERVTKEVEEVEEEIAAAEREHNERKRASELALTQLKLAPKKGKRMSAESSKSIRSGERKSGRRRSTNNAGYGEGEDNDTKEDEARAIELEAAIVSLLREFESRQRFLKRELEVKTRMLRATEREQITARVALRAFAKAACAALEEVEEAQQEKR